MSPTEQHIDLGMPVSRRHPLRKLVARMLWPMLRHQVDFNREILDSLRASEHRLDAIEANVARAQGDLAHHSAVLERHERPHASVEAALGDLLRAVEGHDGAFHRHDEVLERHDEVLERIDRSLSETKVAAGRLEERIEERIELVQRQAFARFHEGNGAIRTDIGEMSRDLLELAAELADVRDRLLTESSDHVESLREQIAASLAELHNTHGAQLTRFRDEAAQRDAATERAFSALRMRLSEVDLFLTAIKRSMPALPSTDVLAALPDAYSGIRDALEDAIAEPAMSVRERLLEYLEEVRPAAKLGAVVDLTVRNGDWLEVLSDVGIMAYGIARHAGRAELSQARGLDVRHEDPLGHLRGVAPSSLGAVTAFGLLEALEVDEILEFFDLAVRALHPGGTLLIECLNPANVIVATSDLYADPLRRRPIAAKSLAFLARARGFIEVSTRFASDGSNEEMRVPATGTPWASDLNPIIELLNERLLSPVHYALFAIRP